VKTRNLLIHEGIVIAVILLNAAAVFAMGFPLDDAHERFWFFVDYGCVAFFVLEAILKLGAGGPASYFASGWNRFDFVITGLSVPVLLVPLIGEHGFSAVPLLRLGRLFRLFRLLRFIPNRAHIAAGVQRALRASIGVLLAVTLVNFILAVGACLLFRDFAPEYFRDPVTACYSMFQVFTVEGWTDIPEAIAAAADHPAWALVARLYFVGAVSVGGILGLSLANAVFVDQMTVDNTDPLQDRIRALTEEVQALRQEIRALAQRDQVPHGR
jgi:voltage-gated sodium channel